MAKIFLFLILISPIVLPSNNMFYLIKSTNEIGIINGATLTAWKTPISFIEPVKDEIIKIDQGDFNGDGRSDLLILTKRSGTAPNKYLYEITTYEIYFDPNSPPEVTFKAKKIWFYEFNVNCEFTPLINAGKLNTDNRDNVNLTFQKETNGPYTWMILSSNNKDSLSVILDKTLNFKIITKVDLIHYDKDLIDEISFNTTVPNSGYNFEIYKNNGSPIYKSSTFPSPVAGWADFNSVGTDQFVYISADSIFIKNTNGVSKAFKITGQIKFIDFGDYNDDGKVEICLIISKVDGNYVQEFNGNGKLIAENFLSKENIKFTCSGDFDGSNGDELFYLSSTESGDKVGVYYFNTLKGVLTNLNKAFYDENVHKMKYDQFSVDQLVVTNSINKNSFIEDRKFKQLIIDNKSFKTEFLLGWQLTGPNEKYKNELLNALNINFIMLTVDSIHTFGANGSGLVRQYINDFYKAGKYMMIQTYKNTFGIDDGNHPNWLPYYSFSNKSNPQFKQWYNDLDSTQKIPGICGFYIGDDSYQQIAKYNKYNTDIFNTHYNVLKNFNKYLCFAADEYHFLIKSLGKMIFDVPIMENYPFYRDSPIEHVLVNEARSFDDLHNYFSKGIMSMNQAHGTNYFKIYGDINPEAWYYSRYDAYTAIVHGCNGIIFFSYDWTDTNTKNNINAICSEIKETSLYSALRKGNVNSNLEVSCNKDGYNHDFNYPYLTVGYYFTGIDINDLNYIVRQDDYGNFYLLIINNSKMEINSTEFYLPEYFPSNVSEISRDSLSNQITHNLSTTSFSKRGIEYKKLYIDTIKPYEVKVIKFGNSAAVNKK